MTAQNGSIGQDSNFLEIQSSVDRFGVLNAQAPGVIRITQTGRVVVETGGLSDLNVDTVTTCYGGSSTSCNDVRLASDAGPILHGHNPAPGPTTPNRFRHNLHPRTPAPATTPTSSTPAAGWWSRTRLSSRGARPRSRTAWSRRTAAT